MVTKTADTTITERGFFDEEYMKHFLKYLVGGLFIGFCIRQLIIYLKW